MKYPWIDEYLLQKPAVQKDFKEEWGWYRYQIGGKLFAAVCSPGPEHRTYGGHDLVNLKCDPAETELLRARYPDILPGFYTNKRNWIACFLDGGLPDEVLRDLCAGSHRLILEKLPKYVQRELLGT